MPFGLQGGPSGYWIMISQGILTGALSAAAPLLRGVNFFHLFQAGVVVDQVTLVLDGRTSAGSLADPLDVASGAGIDADRLARLDE